MQRILWFRFNRDDLSSLADFLLTYLGLLKLERCWLVYEAKFASNAILYLTPDLIFYILNL